MGRQMLSLTGPCLRLTQPLQQLISRLKRLFFLSEGADLSRCDTACRPGSCSAVGMPGMHAAVDVVGVPALDASAYGKSTELLQPMAVQPDHALRTG